MCACGDREELSIVVPAFTTSAGQPYVRTIAGLNAGQLYDLWAFVDVDGSTTLTQAGVFSAEDSSAEASDDAAVTITIDTLQTL